MLRTICAAALAALLLAPFASAQANYTPPKNAMGQPDLGGFWTNATSTGFVRDPKYGDRQALTADELAAFTLRASRDADPAMGVMTINGEGRTSFLVEPKNGRLPPMTPAADAARQAALTARPRGAGYARGDNPESMTLAERCLKDFGSSSGPPMLPVGYNNTYQIVQTPDHVVILVEMIHDARIIPLTKTHKPDVIHPWMGDSVGWYEGDTLVVETTNFRPGQAFRGAPETVKVIEKFRRVADGQILYSFELSDPKVFTAPVKAELAMNTAKGALYEYACHEGNYSFASMLAGQRAADVEMGAMMAAARGKPKR